MRLPQTIKEFVDYVFDNYFTPLISKPTRVTCVSTTLTDNIITSDILIKLMSNQIQVALCTGNTDHMPDLFIKEPVSSCKMKKSVCNRCIMKHF